jgi:lipopolysaccharide export LptBFGC system permease protein LptF
VVPARLGRGPAELAADARAGGEAGARAGLLLHRRAAVAPSALGLSVLALLLGLGRRAGGRPWAVALAAGLILAFHLLARAAEAGVEAGGLDPALGAWIPAMITWIVAVGWVALARNRVLCWNQSGVLPA